jgi:hypothetical protein
VVPYIQGVQSQGVIATVKHYALNNQEFNRHNANSDVDERTMREIYLPAFEAAVVKGHVDAVMDSYNLINGVHATQNDSSTTRFSRASGDSRACSCPTGTPPTTASARPTMASTSKCPTHNS